MPSGCPIPTRRSMRPTSSPCSARSHGPRPRCASSGALSRRADASCAASSSWIPTTSRHAGCASSGTKPASSSRGRRAGGSPTSRVSRCHSPPSEGPAEVASAVPLPAMHGARCRSSTCPGRIRVVSRHRDCRRLRLWTNTLLVDGPVGADDEGQRSRSAPHGAHRSMGARAVSWRGRPAPTPRAGSAPGP